MARAKDHRVAFDVFPGKTSPFHSFIKESRLYTFAQLFAVYHDSGEYAVRFDKAHVVDRSRDETETVRILVNAAVKQTFSSKTIFDHIAGSLNLSYLDHDQLRFSAYNVVGEDYEYSPEEGSTRLDHNAVFLQDELSGTVVTPSALHTDDGELARLTEDGLQHLKTYFSSVMDAAHTGVSHKHYVKFLLEAFPGRIQVRQLPAMYTELEQHRRRANRLDEADQEGWRELADDLDSTVGSLDRELSNDELELLCRTYHRAGTEGRVAEAMSILNDHAAYFAANHAGLVMDVVDSHRSLHGDNPVYDRADTQRVEQRLFEKVRGGRHVHH